MKLIVLIETENSFLERGDDKARLRMLRNALEETTIGEVLSVQEAVTDRGTVSSEIGEEAPKSDIMHVRV